MRGWVLAVLMALGEICSASLRAFRVHARVFVCVRAHVHMHVREHVFVWVRARMQRCALARRSR